jgi:phage gp16-like protein
VESVNFLRQIRLEIQLHWNFEKLKIHRITSDVKEYLKEYKKQRLKEKRGMWCRGLLTGICSSSTAKAEAKRQRDEAKKVEVFKPKSAH